MKTVLIMRHAKSSWANSHIADHERPLNARGQRDAPRMGQLLEREGLVPDLIISSSAERALTTAELVALNCNYTAEIEVSRSLYLAAPSAYLGRLKRVAGEKDRLLFVGHNPGVEELVERFTGKTVRMPTGALAHVELDLRSWHELTEQTRGRLVNHWRPKAL